MEEGGPCASAGSALLRTRMGPVPRRFRGAGRKAGPSTSGLADALASSGPDLLAGLDRLDLVADLDVVDPAESDARLEVRADLGDVVLEPAQRLDRQVVPDDHAVADHPRLRVARDHAAADQHTRDVAELRRAEDLPDLGETRLDLLELRLQHALQRVLHVLEGRVDHRVEPDVDALARGALAGLRVRPDVEADDDRVVDRRQVHVRLGDRADAAVDDPQ